MQNPDTLALRRAAPRPLIAHLAAAAGLSAQAVSAAATFRADLWLPEFREAARDLAEQTDPLTVARVAVDDLADMLAGVEAWRAHPAFRHDPGRDVLWQDGTARLLDCGPPGAPVVLVIPSLVNRAAILDLCPEWSFVDALAADGMRPLLVDWGDPEGPSREFDLAAQLRHRLLPALAAARRANGGRPPAALGYCMGGTLALALAGAAPLSRLALLGAPWHFGSAAGITALARAHSPQITDAIKAARAAFGIVPGDLIQHYFAALDPGQMARKFRDFGTLDPSSAAARKFVLVEDWLNDVVHMAAPTAIDLLQDWYMADLPGRGDWAPLETPVRLGEIDVPTLVVGATRDHICLPDMLPRPETLPPGSRRLMVDRGHVGMIVGRDVARDVVAPVVRHLRAA